MGGNLDNYAAKQSAEEIVVSFLDANTDQSMALLCQDDLGRAQQREPGRPSASTLRIL